MAISCMLGTRSRDVTSWPGGLRRHGPAWIYSKLISDLHSAFYCPSINSHYAPVHSANFDTTRLLFSVFSSDKRPSPTVRDGPQFGRDYRGASCKVPANASGMTSLSWSARHHTLHVR